MDYNPGKDFVSAFNTTYRTGTAGIMARDKRARDKKKEDREDEEYDIKKKDRAEVDAKKILLKKARGELFSGGGQTPGDQMNYGVKRGYELLGDSAYADVQPEIFQMINTLTTSGEGLKDQMYEDSRRKAQEYHLEYQKAGTDDQRSEIITEAYNNALPDGTDYTMTVNGDKITKSHGGESEQMTIDDVMKEVSGSLQSPDDYWADLQGRWDKKSETAAANNTRLQKIRDEIKKEKRGHGRDIEKKKLDALNKVSKEYETYKKDNFQLPEDQLMSAEQFRQKREKEINELYARTGAQPQPQPAPGPGLDPGSTFSAPAAAAATTEPVPTEASVVDPEAAYQEREQQAVNDPNQIPVPTEQSTAIGAPGIPGKVGVGKSGWDELKEGAAHVGGWITGIPEEIGGRINQYAVNKVIKSASDGTITPDEMTLVQQINSMGEDELAQLNLSPQQLDSFKEIISAMLGDTIMPSGPTNVAPNDRGNAVAGAGLPPGAM